MKNRGKVYQALPASFFACVLHSNDVEHDSALIVQINKVL
jgi:hypothetical protein